MRLLLALLVGAVMASCWGSAVPQDPACTAWVACIRALEGREGQPAADLLRFEAGGFCWNNPTLAEGCAAACARAQGRLHAREPSLPPECTP